MRNRANSVLLNIIMSVVIISCLSGPQLYGQVKEFFITCEPDDFEMINANPFEDIYIPITLTYDGTTWNNVEMRIRGDGTRWQPKRSLKVKFDSIPFENGRWKINLNAEYEDPSYIHQYLATRIYSELGLTCFKSEHVRVYLNGKFHGLFLQIENMDEQFLEARGIDPDGSLYKATVNSASLSIFDDIDSLWEKKTNTGAGTDDLQQLIDEINAVSDSAYYEFTKETFDYDNMINMLAMNLILSNISTYYHNYYMYHDLNNTGKWYMFPWDMDKTFNTYGAGFPYTFGASPTSPDNPYFERALLCEPVFNDVKKRLAELDSLIINSDVLGPIIDSLAEVLEPSVQADKGDNIEDDLTKWTDQIGYTRAFINDRYDHLLYQFEKFPASFKINRTKGIYTGEVVLSWHPSYTPNGDEITYSIYYDTQLNLALDDVNIIHGIKDTFYIMSGLEEGIYYWKAVANNNYASTDGFDKYNFFEIKKGSVLPCDIENDMALTKENSPYLVNCDLTVKNGVTLTINEGVELRMNEKTSIWIDGAIIVNGTEDEPVIFRPQENVAHWDSLNIQNPSGKCRFNYVNFSEAVFRIYEADIEFNYLDYTNNNFDLGSPDYYETFFSILKVAGGTPKINNSKFYGNQTGEGILAYHCPIVVENSVFTNIPDPIEYIDLENAIIRNNTISKSNDDGADINGCTNVLIENNTIYNCEDKGVSIGSVYLYQACESIMIRNNIIFNCGMGAAVKESSYADILNNTFYNTGYACHLSEKTEGLGCGKATITNNIISRPEDSEYTNEPVYYEDLSLVSSSYNLSDCGDIPGENNIYASPEFLDAGNYDFNLMETSPCIDAGNPESVLDPDGTRADIGALYYNQAPPKIVINEINYNSLDDYDTGDWVELYNAESVDVDMSRWIIRDSDDAHGYIIPEGTILEAGDYLVICRNYSDFIQLFENVSNALGDMDFGLSGSGDAVRLYDSTYRLIDSVTYDNKSPWPEAPDGQGATLELINPEYDNTLPQSWAASQAYGSPGEKNSRYSDSVGSTVTEFEFVNLYPNPATENLKVECKVPDNVKIGIEIYDVYGNKLNPTIYTMDLQNGLIKYTINMQKYAIGVYYLSLKAAGRDILKPFVIMR